ncbi:MAG: phospholipase D-like domain-containing protein [Casimicrobium sp.]|jgi:cardiolipin synthase
MFHGLAPAYWLTLHGLVSALAVLTYVIASHVLHQRRHPTAAIAWVLFILLMPYVALPAFLMFGSRKRARPDALPIATLDSIYATASWPVQTILTLKQPEPAAFRDFTLHADGEQALRALWDTLDSAQHTIDLCTFILGRDDIGEAVIERLCAKARSGVRVRLLLDGLGSLMAGRPRLRSLTDFGGEFLLFVPPLNAPFRGRSNLRDHRKMLVIDAAHDSRRLWCGGRNLAAEYFEGNAEKAAWHDLTFDLSGPLVLQAHALFEHDWAFARGRRYLALPPPATWLPAPETAGAQLVASGPDQVDDTIYSLLVTAAYRAQTRIALVTPYFVPDSALLLALCLAARRGVAVDLLIPARSNHRMSDVARNRALRTLASAGARVWLAPEMLHAKLAVIDDVLAMAGSANLDSRSLFLNYELMFAFHSAAEIQQFAAWFERERESAVAYIADRPGLLRDVAEGAVLWVGFQL